MILPSGITEIASSAFSHCTGLRSVSFPEGITKIDNNAFSYCQSMTDFELPTSLLTVGAYAFSTCTSLTSINIPSNVTTIENHAFFFCKALERVYLPQSLETILNSAFSECDALSDVYFDGSQEEWSGITIYDSNVDLLNARIHFGGSRAYTITFDPNGGDAAPAAQTAMSGEPVTLPAAVPMHSGQSAASSETGADFIGWSTDPEAEEAEYQPGGTYIGAEDVTLYAVWKLRPMTLTFNVNGGAMESDTTVTVDWGTSFALPTPKMDGHYFKGWRYLIPNSNNYITVKGTLKVIHSYTLTAQWGVIDYILPAGLTVIEEEAFSGITNAVIQLPGTVTSIAKDAFDPTVTVVVEAGSVAETLCTALGLKLISY